MAFDSPPVHSTPPETLSRKAAKAFVTKISEPLFRDLIAVNGFIFSMMIAEGRQLGVKLNEDWENCVNLPGGHRRGAVLDNLRRTLIREFDLLDTIAKSPPHSASQPPGVASSAAQRVPGIL